MSSVLTFKIDKKKPVFIVNKKLVNFIQKFSKKNDQIQILVKKIVNNIDIPKEIIEKRINQILFLKFNYKENKFEDLQTSKIFKDLLIYLGFNLVNIAGHLLLIFKSDEKKEYDLICDNVFGQFSIDCYSRLIKKFSKVCLLGTISPSKKIKNEDYFKFRKFLIGVSSLSLKKKIFFLFLSFKIFYISLKKGINFFSIFNLLVYDIFKSNHIFSNIKGKFFITQKFYNTSTIFNYYFKKNGGKITSCTQKNILSQSLSLFVFTDIMFTYGKEQGKICNQLGGKIKKFIPVGSLFMETKWYKKKKDLKNVPKSDILILGQNTLYNTRHHNNNNYEKDFYEIYLDWLIKLSNDFPHKKIIYKFHDYPIVDPGVIEKIKNTNIKILIKDKSINSSYAYPFRSKLVLSFASSMVVELLGNNKLAYYLDPGLRGDQWFRDIKKLKSFRIGNYKKLKKIVIQKKKTPIKFKNYLCKNSKNTSEMIFENFKKMENFFEK